MALDGSLIRDLLPARRDLAADDLSLSPCWLGFGSDQGLFDDRGPFKCFWSLRIAGVVTRRLAITQLCWSLSRWLLCCIFRLLDLGASDNDGKEKPQEGDVAKVLGGRR